MRASYAMPVPFRRAHQVAPFQLAARPAAPLYLPAPAARSGGARSRGLGDQSGAQFGVQIGTVGATSAVAIAAAAHLIPALAVPFIGAGIAAAALVASYLIKNSGCGQTCIQTSQWANQAADALGQNSAAYFALPAPRSRANQTLALQTFDQIWAKLAQMCGDPQWGNAGKRCISDRQAGACTWRQTRSGGYPGEPALGECWNWFNGYRDPIANDPNVVDDPITSALPASVSSAWASTGLPSWVLPAAALALVAVAL